MISLWPLKVRISLNSVVSFLKLNTFISCREDEVTLCDVQDNYCFT